MIPVFTSEGAPRRRTRLVGGALIAAGLASAALLAPADPAWAQTSSVSAPATPVGTSLAPIVDRVLPAVVNISVVLKPESAAADQGDEGGTPLPGFPQGSPFDEFLRRFFGQQGMGRGFGMPGPQGPQQMPQMPHGGAQRMALGSGFIVDPAGYVVTNNHVVGQAGTVTVTFQDGSKHPAKIVGHDSKTDIALLKIDAPQPLPAVAFGDSDRVRVGDWIIAVGNPFGLGGTVTTGIVSARGRDIHEGPFDDFLQLDAAINRGNSGGPTFDMNGQVIGINTAIYSPNGGSVGIGFAIPSTMAKAVVQQLREHGHVERGWLGVQIQQITPEIARGLGLNPDNPRGALVADVTADSPAAKAGLQVGDVITRFDGRSVDRMHDLPRMVANVAAGRTVDVQVLRHGEERTLPVSIARLDEQRQEKMASAEDSSAPQAETGQALGLHLAPLTASDRRQLHLGNRVSGVLVQSVDDNSPAANIGIEAGDVIQQVNQQPVKSPAEAAAKLAQAAQEKRVLLLLNRHGTNEYIGLSGDQLG